MGDPATTQTVTTAPTPARNSQHGKKGMSDAVKLLLGGAGIGLTVGLINGHDEIEATLMGAAAPFVLLGLLGAWAGQVARLRPSESHPADLHILGEPVRGKLGQILPRALGRAALGLAADRGAGKDASAGGRGSAQPILQYVIRW